MSIYKNLILVLSFSQVFAIDYTGKPLPVYGQRNLLAATESKKELPKKKIEESIVEEESDDTIRYQIKGGLLVWKARNSGSGYVQTSSSSQFALPYRSMIDEANFGYDLGMRFGIGYFTDNDDWMLSSQFTYYAPDKKSRTTAGPTSDLRSPNGFSDSMSDAILDGSGFTTVFFNEATSYYDMKVELLDLMLSRSYQINSIQFTPGMGVEGAWLSSKQRMQYTGGPVLGSNLLAVEDKSRYWGLGPKTALEMKWGLKRGFSLVSDSSLALWVGNLKLDYNERMSHQANWWTRLQLRDKRVIPHASTFLGVGYDSDISLVFKRLHVKAGFEGHFMWNYLVRVRRGEELFFDNLYLFGGTVEVALDF